MGKRSHKVWETIILIVFHSCDEKMSHAIENLLISVPKDFDNKFQNIVFWNLSMIKTLCWLSRLLVHTLDTFHYFKHVYSNNTCCFPSKPLWVLSHLLHQLFSRSITHLIFSCFSPDTCIRFHFHSNKMQWTVCKSIWIYFSEGCDAKLTESKEFLLISVGLWSCLTKSTMLDHQQRESSKYNIKSLFSVVDCFHLNSSAWRISNCNTFHKDQTIKTTFLKLYFKCHIDF